MKRALVIDGGGLKGIIPATVVDQIEQKEGRPIYEQFDLICGTSTGSVIGGALSAGVPGSELRQLYYETVPELFTPRNRFLPKNWFVAEKYDPDPFITLLKQKTTWKKFKQTKTLFLTTAFNLCSRRTHFLHSDDSSENHYGLAEVISWSALSAALYFGKICVGDFKWQYHTPAGEIVNKFGAVFQDGGQGTQNSPITAAILEMLRRWKNEDIEILSLGCGDQDDYVPYEKASKSGVIKQVGRYFGQARLESGVLQHIGAEALDSSWKSFSFRRLNCKINSKLDKLDGRKYVKDYIALGKMLAKKY